MIPEQLPAYLKARQQRGLIRFKALNLIHVPVGTMSVLGLLLLLQHAGCAGAWDRPACRPGAAGADRQRHHLRHLFQSP